MTVRTAIRRSNKYGVRIDDIGKLERTVDGITFHSVREANRWVDLGRLAEANEIEDLKRQVSFQIEINGLKICKYIADFTYTDRRTGEYVVEDSKGAKTQIYKLKKLLLRACHGIEILET